MPHSPVLDLAQSLWPQVRDRGTVDTPADLDALLAAQGQPGAPGYDCGLRHTFACFPPDVEASFVLPAGESPASDDDARFIAHLLVTRTLLGAGLAVDERVVGAMCEAYALSWTAAGSGHGWQSPLALALSLWLPALDPLAGSDRPLPIDWSPECFRDTDRWDPEYRLFSHYDIRERALDWSVYAGGGPERHQGCSMWTIVEPLLRLTSDGRAGMALSSLAQRSGATGEQAPAAAMLERNRVATLLQQHPTQGGGG